MYPRCNCQESFAEDKVCVATQMPLTPYKECGNEIMIDPKVSTTSTTTTTTVTLPKKELFRPTFVFASTPPTQVVTTTTEMVGFNISFPWHCH